MAFNERKNVLAKVVFLTIEHKRIQCINCLSILRAQQPLESRKSDFNS